MNYFEQQLRNFLGAKYAFKSTTPVFIGRTAFLMLTGGRRARIEFVTGEIAGHYERFQITIMSVEDGVIDRLTLHFEDYCKRKYGEAPYFADYQGVYSWYRQDPTGSEIRSLTEAAYDYVLLFD